MQTVLNKNKFAGQQHNCNHKTFLWIQFFLYIFWKKVLPIVFNSIKKCSLFPDTEELCSAPKKVKHDLALLNRSVAIECPHLGVRWFCKSFLSKGRNLAESLLGLTWKSITLCPYCTSIFFFFFPSLKYVLSKARPTVLEPATHNHSKKRHINSALTRLRPLWFPS